MKTRTLSIVSLALLAAASAAIASAASASFAANLRLGDSGPDVLLLQQTLNASADTAVALSGPGSAGQETSYFGALTQDAVKRFQQKYAADVLAPSGLSSPTGFVGPATRAKLDQIVQGASSDSTSAAPTSPLSQLSSAPTPSSPAVSSASTTAADQDPFQVVPFLQSYFADSLNVLRITAQTAKSGPAGTAVVLYGTGLGSTTNAVSVHLGDSAVDSVSQGQVKAAFSIPSSLAPGLYPLWISAGATSTPSDGRRFFVVTDPTVAPPVVSSLSSTTVPYGTSVTIVGDRFSTTTPNTVSTQFGLVAGLPSKDGKTIEFAFSDPKVDALIANRAKSADAPDLKIPVSIDVINKYGMTAHPVVLTIEIAKQ